MRLVNNTDRKGGHILPVDGGRHVHGVDHGVCFSTVPKLRTVLWGWRGTPFEPDELEGLDRIRTALSVELGDQLRPLLSAAELRATRRRVESLLVDGCFPLPRPTGPPSPGRPSSGARTGPGKARPPGPAREPGGLSRENEVEAVSRPMS